MVVKETVGDAKVTLVDHEEVFMMIEPMENVSTD